jgi:hypothetical protein
MQRDNRKKRSEKDQGKRLSDPKDEIFLGEMERVRAEIARLQLQVEEISAAFDRQ